MLLVLLKAPEDLQSDTFFVTRLPASELRGTHCQLFTAQDLMMYDHHVATGFSRIGRHEKKRAMAQQDMDGSRSLSITDLFVQIRRML